MQKIYFDTRELDVLAREKFSLSEELMMENAAAALESVLTKNVAGQGVGKAQCVQQQKGFEARPFVLILCGAGNNGADGYALARRLCGTMQVCVCKIGEPKTEIAKLQKQRAEKLGVKIITCDELKNYIEKNCTSLCAVVDCIFGAGFRLPLGEDAARAIQIVNKIENVYKLACDIPSGLDALGNCGFDSNGEPIVFAADETVAMGALKIALYSDNAKDFCGKISVANLGIARKNFETPNAEFFLLEENDLCLPFRKKQNVHKASFGHLAILCGEKPGAAQIAGTAALTFGAGLVTLVGVVSCSEMQLMCSNEFPPKISAAALGMGLGHNYNAEKAFSYLNQNKIPCLLDADIFYNPAICEFLKYRSQNKLPTILTPHPKEFCALLENCGLGTFSVPEVLSTKIDLVKKFAATFPEVVLLLKGANTFIATFTDRGAGSMLNGFANSEIFVNALGTNALAKAGSGDVLAGLAAALLAQGYDALTAAQTASLAHALASRQVKNNFSLTPKSLMKNIENL